MPTTLPVPSKSALRALRSLALGTSCTVALSAGLLTEDRRRRIRAAREVHDNAKKLKASRQYHSTNTAALETFGDQLLRYREDAIWLPSNVLKGTIPKAAVGKVRDDGCEVPDPSPAPEATTGKLVEDVYEIRDSLPSPTPEPRPLRISKWKTVFSKDLPPSKSPFLPFQSDKIFYRSAKIPKQQLHNRQGKLASDVTKLLQQTGNIDEAAARFFDAFEEGLPIDGNSASQRLVEVAIQLANACEAEFNFESSDKVFDIILNSGSLHEEQFYSFHPEDVISRLLASSDGNPLQPEKLRKASSIFLTKFKEKPKNTSERMLLLGERLCAETCRAEMYDLTLGVCSRLQCDPEQFPLSTVGPRIIASHKKGYHKNVFRLFHRFYLQTTPDQQDFYHVGSLAIESILKTRKIDRAVQALVDAHEMAEKIGISVSTTWFIKVLGYEWRTRRDLDQTKALFERLEPLIHLTQHPQAFYGAMIQFCIEADNEPLAHWYYDRLRESYPPNPADVRIYGHFAFAKAKRHDWLGVKDDFVRMKQASPGSESLLELAFSFAPILHLYVQSHSIGAIEEFLRFFIDEVGIKPTKNIINIMVETYGKAREKESLFRWIDYASEAGCPIDAVTFNTILKNCSQGWKFSFWDVFGLYTSVCELGPWHSRFLDGDTVPIMRRIALLGSPSQEELAQRLDALKKLDQAPKNMLDRRTVLRAMAVTLAKQNPTATLKIYARAQRDGVLLGSEHVQLAVRASLEIHPDNPEETLRHVQRAQQLGVDVSMAAATIIIHQMTAMDTDGDKDSRPIIELAERTINTLQRCGTRVDRAIVVKAVSILEKRGHYRLCIDVWGSLSQRLSIPPSSYDLVILNTLLKAYIGLRDHIGIQWIVKTISANEIRPDAKFRLHLKNARRKTIDHINSGGAHHNCQQFLDSVLEALEATGSMQDELRQEKRDLKYRTVQIIEKAIADEAARQFDPLGSSAPCATLSKTLSIEDSESWSPMPLQKNEGSYYETGHSAAQMLVEVAAS
jgi:hypothetical protein